MPPGREEKCRRHECGSRQADVVGFERPSSSMQRDKMALVLLSASLVHAAWQDGGDGFLLSHRSRTSLSAFSPRKVDGTGAKDLWCVPAGFTQGPVCESRPGLYTRPGQIGVGLRRRIDGMKDVSSRAGSQDSQRLHDWTQDEPVDDLRLDP